MNVKKREFKTLLKSDWSSIVNGNNLFVRGYITGVMDSICGIKRYHMVDGCDEGFILTCKCTPNQYERFSKIVEEQCPEVCIFDYKMDES